MNVGNISVWQNDVFGQMAVMWGGLLGLACPWCYRPIKTRHTPRYTLKLHTIS